MYFILFLLILLKQGFSEVLIHLPNGAIRGKQSVTYTNRTFYSFEKVPYASPPVGKLRFQAPISSKNWNGVLDATNNNVICYQVGLNFPTESEDCLYLNIYTPQLSLTNDDQLLPVIFYIHGGGFIGGTCLHSICGPEFLIDYNVVVVTINYRLGPFGFLSTQDNEIPGNNGLKDQQLGLKWTHDNIKLFGGDPSRITLVGQSAGSASVSYQMLNKKSEGLFWGAICESGSFLSPWSFQRQARKFAFQTASFINETFKNSNNSNELHTFLLTVTADELDKASFQVHQMENLKSRQISQGYFYAPVLEPEHKNAFITTKMYGNLKSGNFVKVPIIIGITSEEALEEAKDLDLLKNMMKTYDANLDWLVPDDLNIRDEEKRKTVGELIRSFYTTSIFQNNLAAGIRFLSDTSFTRSVIKHAQLQSKFTDVYFYQFSYDGVIGNVSTLIKGAEAVSHTEDLRYMWSTVFQGYDNTNIEMFPEEDKIIQRRLLTLWTNFAKTLKPVEEKIIYWPTVSSGRPKDFWYLDINKNLTIKNYPKIGTYLGWNMVYDLFGEEQFDTF